MSIHISFMHSSTNIHGEIFGEASTKASESKFPIFFEKHRSSFSLVFHYARVLACHGSDGYGCPSISHSFIFPRISMERISEKRAPRRARASLRSSNANHVPFREGWGGNFLPEEHKSSFSPSRATRRGPGPVVGITDGESSNIHGEIFREASTQGVR